MTTDFHSHSLDKYISLDFAAVVAAAIKLRVFPRAPLTD